MDLLPLRLHEILWDLPADERYIALASTFRSHSGAGGGAVRNRRRRAVALRIYEFLWDRLRDLEAWDHQQYVGHRWTLVSQDGFQFTQGVPLFDRDSELLGTEGDASELNAEGDASELNAEGDASEGLNAEGDASEQAEGAEAFNGQVGEDAATEPSDTCARSRSPPRTVVANLPPTPRLPRPKIDGVKTPKPPLPRPKRC